MTTSPKHPWRLDTNERYREVVRLLIGLSTASLLLPVFFSREFLQIESNIPLASVFTWSVYSSWACLTVSILAGVMFHFLSALWVRLAWGQPAKLWGFHVSENLVDRALDITFWSTVLAFLSGLAAIMGFIVAYEPRP